MHVSTKSQTIEIDEATATALKERADARGKQAVSDEPDAEDLERAACQGHRRDIEMREDLAAGGQAPATTQVADGLPRRAWTVDEVERMVEYGVLREPEPFELIGGELVAMAPKERRHEVLRTAS